MQNDNTYVRNKIHLCQKYITNLSCFKIQTFDDLNQGSEYKRYNSVYTIDAAFLYQPTESEN